MSDIRKTLLCSAVIVLAACSRSLAASPSRIGLYNSLKGYGFQVHFQNNSNRQSFSTLTLYADLLDIYFSSGSTVGIKAVYQGKHIMHYIAGENFKYNFYLGAGVQGGYCGDTFFQYFKQPGVEFGASLCAGWLMEFTGRIDLELSFSLEAGLHLRNEETYGTTAMSFYINGVTRSFLPDLTIYYRF